ncbi:MAG: DUF1801 domain-containing protein [Kofleriaceae bacterium]
MPEQKTKKTKASVAAFINAVRSDARRKDAKAVDKMFREITGEKPAMWGPSIIGYGSYDSPTGTWPRGGFSPRDANLVLYVVADYAGRDALLKQLGKHRSGKSCLYINKLADVDERTLRELIARAWKHMEAK